MLDKIKDLTAKKLADNSDIKDMTMEDLRTLLVELDKKIDSTKNKKDRATIIARRNAVVSEIIMRVQ